MPRTLLAAIVAILVLAAAAALEFYSHTVSAISVGGPVPLQSLAPRSPVPTPSPAPNASVPPVKATIAQTARPSTPVPVHGPAIVSMSLSPPVVTGGQIVTGTVQTSADVTGVHASIGSYSSALTKVSAGYFALSYRVPNLPSFLHRTYTIVVTAQNGRGESVSSSLPITIR